MKSCDYSRIAQKFDRDPLRHRQPEKILIDAINRKYLISDCLRVIDIGCGSGNWLVVNRENLSKYKRVKWYGVDVSEEMLALARVKTNMVSYTLASADVLPFSDGVFDFVITEYTCHHFDKKRETFEEIYRITKKGGVFLIRNIDPWCMKGWVLYYFFPEARPIDEKRFLKTQAITNMLGDLGFKRIYTKLVTKRGNIYGTVDEWFDVMRNRTHSQLQLISEREYVRGIKKISHMYIKKRDRLEAILAKNVGTLVEVRSYK